MTIVELYDEIPIRNIVGTLAFKPDKVIFVGGNSKKNFESKKLPVLKKYFDKKGFSSLIIEFVQVKRDSLKDVIDKLERVYYENNNPKFHVEITGGEDLILVGLGVVCQKHPDIELYQISSRLRSIRSFSVNNPDGNKLNLYCSNTVEENLLLHGASIKRIDEEDVLLREYVKQDYFSNDINIMWNLCRNGFGKSNISAPNSWNKMVSIMSGFLSNGTFSIENNTLIVNNEHIKSILWKNEKNIFYKYLNYLHRYKLIRFVNDDDGIVIQFKNNIVKKCLSKAGLILELKTFLVCSKMMLERKGDCLTSVTVDWDGDEDLNSTVKYLNNVDDPNSTIDTQNEIDVLVNCGLVPCFISCKNGKCTSEELYKLFTVGERFGKGYGKKIIVASNLKYTLGDATNVLLQRAADMGIIIIDNVYNMSDDTFYSELEKAMELPKK